MNEGRTYRGRIAPTPSGLLHLGHAETFFETWRRARERGGTLVFRNEDIDRARCKKEYARAAIEDLAALGLDWDEGGGKGGAYAPYDQSLRFGYYKTLLERLSALGLVYPSDASRAKVAELGKFPARRFGFAPPEKIFPPKLRQNAAEISEVENPFARNWRFRVPDGEAVKFRDGRLGEQLFTAGEDFGDFLVWRRSGEPSYELAVVADDAAMRITEVVRGEDLLLSTARQILLYRALGFEIPDFFHCPLKLGGDGNKLSKSSMDKSAANKMLLRNLDQAERAAFRLRVQAVRDALRLRNCGGSRAEL